MDPDKEARRRLREATWETRIFRRGQEEEQAQANTEFWLRVPIGERAALVSELSCEIYSLMPGSGDAQPGSSRSVVRLLRR